MVRRLHASPMRCEVKCGGGTANAVFLVNTNYVFDLQVGAQYVGYRKPSTSCRFLHDWLVRVSLHETRRKNHTTRCLFLLCIQTSTCLKQRIRCNTTVARARSGEVRGKRTRFGTHPQKTRIISHHIQSYQCHPMLCKVVACQKQIQVTF